MYGPVSSRRLGRSLGLDLAPYKTCPYDCIYCQLGRTTNKTLDIKDYVPLEALVDQLEDKLRRGPRPDYITLAGSGEPTLYSRIGELINLIKSRHDIPLAVLTNGSLLWMDEVANALLPADLVVPSLDAGDSAVFQSVNRPHPDIDFAKMAEGLVGFRRRFHRKIWLEVFLLDNINSSEEDVEELARLADRIQPDLIQLNTVSRPPCEDYARPVSRPRLDQLASLFRQETQVVCETADGREAEDAQPGLVADDEILALLARRPCTVNGVAAALSIHVNEASKRLQKLFGQGTVSVRRENNDTFYLIKPGG